MNPTDQLLLNNKSWAEERRRADPEFFDRISKGQQPQFLWIGCADSRVPANQITGTESGEIFVHRNIANLVIPTDLSLLSVLEYAVGVLKVPHIIVCGHHQCGGVNAAMQPRYIGAVSHWLRAIRDVYETHYDDVQAQPEAARADRLCEHSVRDQVHKLAKISVIQKAWAEGGGPSLHGWVYALNDGILQELVKLSPGDPSVSSVHRVEL